MNNLDFIFKYKYDKFGKIWINHKKEYYKLTKENIKKYKFLNKYHV